MFAHLNRYAPFRQLGFTDGNMFIRWDRWVSEDSLNGHHCSPNHHCLLLRLHRRGKTAASRRRLGE